MKMRLRIVVVAVAWVFATVMWGQGSKVSSSVELAHVADHLKPGQWVWAPKVAPDGPVLVYVDLSRQIATVYRNGIRIGVTTISSGRVNYKTPTGVFTILQKQVDHHSSSFHGAAMPYMQRLTWYGIALHAGGLPGYPESHGCIHLPYAFSKELYAITQSGTTVVVAGDAVSHVDTEDGSLLEPMDVEGAATTREFLGGDEFHWTPEKSPMGPMTIIISKKDQRIVVLRNGVEIGRSKAEIDAADQDTHVVSLKAGPGGKQQWIYVGLPGHTKDAGRVVDEAAINRVKMPREFYEELAPELKPGTTALITRSSVGTKPTSEPVSILDGVSPQQK